MICVDHWNGYPMFSSLSATTSTSVINTLTTWFNKIGWPQSVRSKSQHRQLLSTSAFANVSGPPPGGECPVEHQGARVHPSEAAKWVRTPSGLASVPGVYLLTPGPDAQLPFPHFPPMCYDGTLERGGCPFSPFPNVNFRGGEAVG